FVQWVMEEVVETREARRHRIPLLQIRLLLLHAIRAEFVAVNQILHLQCRQPLGQLVQEVPDEPHLMVSPRQCEHGGSLAVGRETIGCRSRMVPSGPEPSLSSFSIPGAKKKKSESSR